MKNQITRESLQRIEPPNSHMPNGVALEQRKKKPHVPLPYYKERKKTWKKISQATLRSQIQNDFYTMTNDIDEETKSKEVSPPPNILPFGLKQWNIQGFSFMQKNLLKSL